MPNGSSEGVKVKRWKPVFSLDRTAEGVRGIKVKLLAPSPSRPSFRIPAFLLGNLIVFGSRPPGQPAVTQTASLVRRVRGGLSRMAYGAKNESSESAESKNGISALGKPGKPSLGLPLKTLTRHSSATLPP